MSRLSIELTPEQHKAIKAMALLEGESIKDWLWGLVEPKLRTHRHPKKSKGYGAGHPDCPLCRIHAKNGRYNAKTERGLRQSLKEIKEGKAKRYASFEALMADLKN